MSVYDEERERQRARWDSWKGFRTGCMWVLILLAVLGVAGIIVNAIMQADSAANANP